MPNLKAGNFFGFTVKGYPDEVLQDMAGIIEKHENVVEAEICADGSIYVDLAYPMDKQEFEGEVMVAIDTDTDIQRRIFAVAEMEPVRMEVEGV